MSFTDKELCLISNGLLALIHNAGTAKTLVSDSDTHAAIEAEIEQLVKLNSKVCGIMKE